MSWDFHIIFGAATNGLVDVMDEVEELWFEGSQRARSFGEDVEV